VHALVKYVVAYTQACERVLLSLFMHPDSLEFHVPVNPDLVTDYYNKIDQPIALDEIKARLRHRAADHWHSVRSFIGGLNRMFKNCSTYNQVNADG
jgi:hypothetical protein